jgi:hypothetical protein
MENRSKTHHYVPQSLLKLFSIDNLEKQVYAFDKTNDNSYPLSIKNAGSEKYFYSIRKGDQEFNFENLFSDVDSFLGNILIKIVTDKTLETLNENEKKGLIYITALQMLRTRETLNDLKNINDFLFEVAHQISKDLNVPLENFEPKLEEFDEETAKITFLDLNKTLAEFTKCLENKVVTLSITSDDNPFWCSDNPVVQNNIYSFADTGLSNQGTEIYFPISKNLLITFNCRSKLYENPYKSELINSPEYENNLVNQLNYKLVRKSDSENVLYYNSLQVRNSSRFVYSNINCFDMAKRFLMDYPHTRNSHTKSPFKLIKDEGKKDYPECPLGTYLICHGEKSYHELEVKEFNFPELIFNAKYFNKLGQAITEKKILEIKFIKDGDFIFNVRDVKIELIEKSTCKFKIIFNNSEMEKILKR